MEKINKKVNLIKRILKEIVKENMGNARNSYERLLNYSAYLYNKKTKQVMNLEYFNTAYKELKYSN